MHYSGPFGIAEKPCRSISKKIMRSPKIRPHVVRIRKFLSFPRVGPFGGNLSFFGLLDMDLWRYVALCGDLWRYVEISGDGNIMHLLDFLK